MMAKVLTHLSRYRRIMNFADQRLSELEEGIETSKAELEMWKDIKYSVRPCPRCHGEGQIRTPEDSPSPQLLSEEEIENCSRCAGSGKTG